MNGKKHIALACALASALVAGCGGGHDGAQTGTLSVSLTDSPVDGAESVVIEFTGLELKPRGGPPEMFSLDVDSCDEFLTDGNCKIDLMTLRGTNYRPVFVRNLPAGVYEWIRLLVNAEQNTVDSYITFDEDGLAGTKCSLWIPSEAETGLKIVSGVTVTANDVSYYMLDFDVRKSVTRPEGLTDPLTACAENYVLKPAIRMVDETVTGSIEGSIETGLLSDSSCRDLDPADGIIDDIAVYVFEDFDATNTMMADDYDGSGDPIASAIVESVDGTAYTYAVGYLLPGQYQLALTCTPDVDDITQDNFNCDSGCVTTTPEFSFLTQEAAVVDVAINNVDL